MEPSAIIDEVKNAILRGRGGAGFPPAKCSTPEDVVNRGYLAINCDKQTRDFQDRLLVDFDPHRLGRHCHRAGPANWTRVLLHSWEYPSQAITMQRAIDEAEMGVFGGNGLLGKCDFDELPLHRGAGPSVVKTGLLEAIEGRRGWPRLNPPSRRSRSL